MPIKEITPAEEINAYFDVWLKRRNMAVINHLSYIGEMCLTEARTNHNYTDRTGNLTSSMGYVLSVNGKIHSHGGFDGAGAGAEKGQKLAKEVSSRYPDDIMLILVAGERYAVYVSSRYNVLDSAYLVGDREVKTMIQKFV